MSAGLYHINLETGEPGPCGAKMGNCPFGSEDLHFTSMEAARGAYETYAAVEKAKSLQAWKKKPQREVSTPPTLSSSHGSGGSGGRHGGTGYGPGVGSHGAINQQASRLSPPPARSYSGHGSPARGGHGR